MTEERSQPSVTLAGGGVMPLVGFGTWQLSGPRCYDAVRAALDVGYRLIDTATIYGNEREVGRAVRDSGMAREELFVTTKLPPHHAGRERATIAASLRALGMDFVDLWLIHWPPRVAARLATWKALLAIRDEGLARAVGVSNYRTAQLDELVTATGEMPEVNQIRWSPALYDAAPLAEHRRRGVVLEGYSPFKTSNLRDATLAEVAAGHGVTTAQVVLRWHVDRGVVVIPKSGHRDRIQSNFDLFGFSLSDEELRRIDGLSRA
jgi:diketogulonate reductase-like aldo/keto reductase